MEIEVTKDQNRAILKLNGNLDIHTSMDLKSVLEKNVDDSIKVVIIDMDKLNFIDSSGIGTLIKSLNFVQGKGGQLYVVNMKPVIEKVFKVSGLTSYFEILTTEEYDKILS